MNGKILKEAISKSGKSIPEIAILSEIDVRTLRRQLEKEYVKPEYVDKLKKADIFCPEKVDKMTENEQYEKLLKENEHLKHLNSILEDQVKVLHYILLEKKKTSFEKKEEMKEEVMAQKKDGD